MSIILTVSRRAEEVRNVAEADMGQAIWNGGNMPQQRGMRREPDDIMSVELTEEQWNAVKRAVLNTF
jgi:hypothetical protein